MAASAAMITQVRRWTKEPSIPPTGTYADADIAAIIELFPLLDERGVAPYWYDTSTDPPTQTATTGWYPTYDLHRAAAHVWDEKAALLAEEVDRPYQGPGPGTHRETQPRDFALAMARYHRSRASASTIQLVQWPSRNRRGDSVVGNLAEE